MSLSDPSPVLAAAPPRRRVLGNALGIGSMVTWAAGFPAAEILLDSWDPLALVVARTALALAVLWPVWLWLDGPRRIAATRWPRAIWIGAGFGAGAWLIILSQWFTDPVTVAIIAASSPLTATLVEWLAERRPLTRAFGIGLAAALLGGIVATGVLTGTPVPGGLGLGAALALGSCLLFSWASYRTVRDLSGMSVIGQTTATTTGALVFVALVFAALLPAGATVLPSAPGATDLGLLAIYGIGAMAVSQFLWLGAVDRLGVSIASFHINVAPFYVMLILVALGQDWSWPQAIGAAIVGAGVIVAQRGS